MAETQEKQPAAVPASRQSTTIARFNLSDIFAEVDDNIFEDAAVAQEFYCPICLCPLNDPIQLICNGQLEGHRTCSGCMRNIKRCPSCNVRCEKGLKDHAAARAMRLLRVKCPFCQVHRCELAGLEAHCRHCEAAIAVLPKLCPVPVCDFRAETEEDLQTHLLEGFQHHVTLSIPKPPPFSTSSSKDTAQIYLPDLSDMFSASEPKQAPVFWAGSGYLCLFQVGPGLNGLKCSLRFYRSTSLPNVVWPFPLPFVFHLMNPDEVCVVKTYNVDFHITSETRDTDPNINPEPIPQWTAGISHEFNEAECRALNPTHLVVVVTVLPQRDRTV
eukprot:TRINITY_DN63816_c0_g1_i1.p1 TRINITY_DN63816_c0_g1~~TRINITY_DN63816_c0_g1_i1.p1  ORF type:complete len:329 (+),score=18.74 TRINITY_DN63816_c0_g1_i1:130-1116(+)